MHDDDKHYDNEDKAVAQDRNQVCDGFMVHHIQSRFKIKNSIYNDMGECQDFLKI